MVQTRSALLWFSGQHSGGRLMSQRRTLSSVLLFCSGTGSQRELAARLAQEREDVFGGALFKRFLIGQLERDGEAGRLVFFFLRATSLKQFVLKAFPTFIFSEVRDLK